MSYQVLARKWRPKTFTEVVGQQHITQALTNALQQNRLHHAYLFTGTRGVGKTTLARIVAKCLNCEQGISATPCGKCPSCLAIEQGQFMDLIEVDAASRTKVEDTRELLDNVQYAPSHGRYKIYLIDEVHMLSGHSFNALLKTLEEPPEHVKFLLATTDPQKLPITVLSRCLQFNLKILTLEQISKQLQQILEQEQISYEPAALTRLAQAANGSLRDSLSLLDQAISYSNNNISVDAINKMLSTLATDQLHKLLKYIENKELNNIFNVIQELSEQAVDFGKVLEELLSAFHHLALLQADPKLQHPDWGEISQLQKLAGQFSPEELQLYYQIALIGRRDLPLAPTPRSGFEMLMLRILAFAPSSFAKATEGTASQVTTKKRADSSNNNGLTDSKIFEKLEISGATKALANSCALQEITDSRVQLLLHAKHAPMLHNKHINRLNEAFTKYLGRPILVDIKVVRETLETPNSIKNAAQIQQQQAAEQTLETDQNILALKSVFNATIIPGSTTPNQE